MTEDEAFEEWMVAYDAHREGRKAEAIAMWQAIKAACPTWMNVLMRGYRYPNGQPAQVTVGGVDQAAGDM